MIYPSGDKLEALVESKYALVVLAAKRAKQLREGAPKLIETESTNPLTVALEEIAAGKVTAKLPTESELTAMETRRRQAFDAFEPEAAGAAEKAPVETAPTVQELLRVEGEAPVVELPAEVVVQASVAEMLKVEGEEEAVEEKLSAESVADMLRIDAVEEEEPLAEEAAAESADAEAADPEAAETGLSEE